MTDLCVMRSGVGEGRDRTVFCISVHCVSKQADGVTTATVSFSSPQVVVKLAPSPTCNCDLEDQTAEHILQRCPLLQRQQEQTCGQQQSSYAPKCTAAKRNWRRRPHSSCRLDSQCSGDREEEEVVKLCNRPGRKLLLDIFFYSTR